MQDYHPSMERQATVGPRDTGHSPIRPWTSASPSWDERADELSSETWSLLQRLPKAELHLHLDGALRVDTAFELARDRAPSSLGGVLTREAVMRCLVGPRVVRDQAELLEGYELPVQLMQDTYALERITSELVEDIAADGTRYAEIRWAPTLHTARGLSLDAGITAVVRGARMGMRRAPGVVIRLVAVVMRSHPPEQGAAMAEAAARFIDDGLTGFDIAGPEAAFPDPLLHRRAFEIARSAGLGITVHAGEWGGAAQVRHALALDPSRIAHGSPAADDPSLQAELRASGVTLDLCPTSNTRAAIVARFEDHPLPRLLRAGVPVTLNTDDRTVSDLSLVREYARAHASLGMTLPELAAMARHAFAAAFLHREEPLRASLLGEFDAFVAAEPQLQG